jgi:cytochrome c-type biogenesis protein
VTGIESLRLGFAFGLGTATFFAPCALPLLPGYVAFFLGDDEAVDEAVSWRLARAVGISLTTSLGFLVVYGLLAAVVFAVGTQALGSISLLELVVGAILVVIGVLMATGRKISLPVTIQLPERRRGVIGYFAFGVVYAAAAAGCTAGLFIALVGIALPAGAVGGLALVGAYAAGMAVLLTVVTVLSALGRGVLIQRLAASGERIRRVAGVVLVLAGVIQLYYFVYVFDGLAMLG